MEVEVDGDDDDILLQIIDKIDFVIYNYDNYGKRNCIVVVNR